MVSELDSAGTAEGRPGSKMAAPRALVRSEAHAFRLMLKMGPGRLVLVVENGSGVGVLRRLWPIVLAAGTFLVGLAARH